jgi:hypothetical protein
LNGFEHLKALVLLILCNLKQRLFKFTKKNLISISLNLVSKLFINQFFTMKLFTKENGVTFIVVLSAVMVGLAVHQRYVAPMISKKA